MWLFVIFILVPLIEIGLFIQVGGWIGLWPTLGLVLGMAVLGSWLLKRQGMMALSDVQRSAQDLRDPTEPIAHGFLIIFAGLLMITPGFFTDLIGLSLLFRPVRSLVLRQIASRFRVQTDFADRGRHPPQSDIVDGDFHEVTPERDTLPPSGWQRH